MVPRSLQVWKGFDIFVSMLIKVTISELGFDPQSNVPVMVLREENGSRTLPIWIGVAEASSIAAHKESAKPERPLTHDLMKLIIDGLNARLAKVTIDNFRNNTFYAKLFLQNGSQMVCIDARPSDAVALAIRCNAPMYIEEHILNGKDDEKAGQKPDNDLRRTVREIDPSDFGKYSLGNSTGPA